MFEEVWYRHRIDDDTLRCEVSTWTTVPMKRKQLYTSQVGRKRVQRSERGAPRTRAVAYLRVSTERQADGGTSLEGQRNQINGYAKLFDLDIVAWKQDPGVSGKTLKRPGVQDALRLLGNGRADALVVAKLDRLTRSLRDLGLLLDRYFQAEGKALLSVAEQVDTRTATGRMVLNVFTTIAQWEREQIGERVSAMHAVKRVRRERVGRPPYGLRVASDGRTLEPDPAEQAALEVLWGLRQQGVSLRGIAQELQHRGHPSRGARWHPTTVARIVARGSERS